MTERATPQPCPSADITAAFVEGTLDTSARKIIELHLADCAECAIVIAGAVQFLSSGEQEEEEDSDAHRREWWHLAVAAALAAVCIPVLFWRTFQMRDPLSGVRSAAASTATRPVEGQISGFAYAPFDLRRSDMVRQADFNLRAEVEKVARRGGTNAEALHACGVAAMMVGRTKDAGWMLTAAARLAPRNATYWNDLAVAEIARATAGRDGDSFRAAQAAADRAIEISPTLAAAHFNRGLALSHLAYRDEAVRSYRSALRFGAPSLWQEEIRARIDRLTEAR